MRSDLETPEAGSAPHIVTFLGLDHGLAIGVVKGQLDVEQLKRGAEALWQTPGWLGYAVLGDLRQARLDLDRSGPERFAQFIRSREPRPPPRRVAWVTPTDLDFGLARVFQAYRENSETECEVFRDYETAVKWATDTLAP